MDANLLDIIKALYSVVFLLVFSIQDYRAREISDSLVYLFTGGSVCLFLLGIYYNGVPPLLYLVTSSIVPLLFLALYFTGLMGEGDVYVVAALTLLYPSPPGLTLYGAPVLPPMLTITLYSTLLIVVITVAYGFYTIARYHGLLRDIPPRYRFIYPFIARPMRLRDFFEARFYYPLTIPELLGDGSVRITYRLHYDVEDEEPGRYREVFKSLVEKGLASVDTYIWVSYGIPYIIPLFIGLVLYIMLGDSLVVSLLRVFISH